MMSRIRRVQRLTRDRGASAVEYGLIVTAVAGLTVRVELLGVTSIVRALNLRPSLYTKLLDHFHSSGIELDRLSALWARAVLGLFPSPVRINGRLVLVGDGIKAPKRGRKMPAVKLLHQQSESNTKPEYIMGHSMQAVGLLVHAAKSVFSVPLAVRIHEGLVWSNRDKRTLLDKMLGLIDILALKAPFYFVADAYYAAGKMARGLLKQGNIGLALVTTGHHGPVHRCRRHCIDLHTIVPYTHNMQMRQHYSQQLERLGYNDRTFQPQILGYLGKFKPLLKRVPSWSRQMWVGP